MVCLWRLVLATLLSVSTVDASSSSTSGIAALANRLFPGHSDAFEFKLTAENENWSRWNPPVNDNYTVKAGGQKGRILVEGTTLNALARGLRHYANEVLQIDHFFRVDTYKSAPDSLPVPIEDLEGASIVPWRYNLNTVTFSYTFAWWQWVDWERFLDWAALRGVNLQLAWVGYEKIFLDSFKELGLKDQDVLPFFSGPAFQSWNRFGNVQGSWGGRGDLPLEFINQQFDLQKKIVARMVELGITPVLPAFPGFVPSTIKKVRPDAQLTASPNWFSPAPDKFTRDLFLSPVDDTYTELQKLFVSKQIRAFGNVTNIYTLDQFNELAPASGDAKYLSDISKHTYDGLTAANPAAVWLFQGWLFYSSRGFWTQPRIDAYLGGVRDNQGMLILDLYSEANPQWQRTNSYSGKRWIWCQLHDFGGNMALEGRVQTITSGPIDALSQSKSLVGFGLTPEGFEGNEIVYDMLLDQAWASSPLSTQQYFQDWTTRRYSLGAQSLPTELYEASEMLRSNVYSNARTDIPQVPLATYQLRPALSGIVNRTGHFPHPTAVHYDPVVLQKAWQLMFRSALGQSTLWSVPTFQLDLVDITRQVLSNAFDFRYNDLIQAYQCRISKSIELRSSSSSCDVKATGRKLLNLLSTLDYVLSADAHFALDVWTGGAQHWGARSGNQDLFAFNARSQITVWQVDASDLNDYAAKAWSGLVGSYYKGRWSIFVDMLTTGEPDQAALTQALRTFEVKWQAEGSEQTERKAPDLKTLMKELMRAWPDVFPEVS
ncbi:hypothetical protein C2857_000298 [Epichloe festucae Fl1]|uniref:Alpha-N-acetylglucosaminidase n=1 Tax=Epichloe festucae (strain Fl1) TaxID=877507 RepID=A0A7S9KR96_EPIFF|nr:hypothetical protein C2857_000298 [Epichloe festucae Fl1]